MANLVFETEKKLQQKDPANGLQRNVDRMKAVLEEAGLMMLNPLGETFTETRTDVEATITGTGHHPLTINEVLKPVIYIEQDNKKMLVQRGVVLAG